MNRIPLAAPLALAALLTLLAPTALGQPAPRAPERYSEVRLSIPAEVDLVAARARLVERLAAHGVHLDHARVEPTASGRALRAVLSETELAAARAAGLAVEVLTDDLAAEAAARPPFPELERRAALRAGGIDGNVFGSMGGFPTLDEALAILDEMRAAYPDLITARVSLGQSHEGRPIWMVEVSDNPGVDEGEPEVLINALHHAREPAGLTTVLYTLWYLLENYGADAKVRSLVNTRRLFVVPVVNPDGYVYNEATNPNGGGYWRKNRRDNGGGVYGVDLNRNWGYQWGYDNVGSSPQPSSETYRGPAPFSEPEVVALRDFLENGRSVRTAFNYHTYGDLLLFAWAYDDLYTPDHALFTSYARRLTSVNHYTYGTSPDVLYVSNGNANDWMYGEQTTKPKMISFTPEVGPDFWPPASEIVPLAEENLRANLLLLQLAGFPVPTDLAADAGVSDMGVPGAFGLHLPNPVVGAATLTFTLPEPGPARLAVYDVLGREVARLVDGDEEAGEHAAVFDGSRLPSGVYLVRLEADGAMQTRRITLVQ